MTPRERLVALVLTSLVLAVTTLSFPTTAAAAALPSQAQPGTLCSVEEWKADFKGCVDRLGEVSGQRAQCLSAPTPSAPDSGMAGWFASRPESSTRPGAAGVYSQYGYAGYHYTTYDLGGCASGLVNVDQKFETTIANGEFMIATGIIGAANAIRERAWDPSQMWGWADPLVRNATQAAYQQVFSVFGVVTLAIVGLYLLWRSRQSDMSATMTTAGWAVLVMVLVTALAAWPVFSANIADQTLTSALGAVHGAVGPASRAIPAEQCRLPDRSACADNRPPAIRASDTVTDSFLYRNWLRGTLGSADSQTAQKYGLALYDAKSLTWGEIEGIRRDPASRTVVIQQKNDQWMKVAEQIRAEDPEAYEYLQGAHGMDRVGAGFIALLAAVLFATFDITAALLVLIGFLLIRWAVIAAPIIGTVSLFRPASIWLRTLGNYVVAALFTVITFGIGSAIYLLAVDVIMGTTTLPPWLRVVLVGLSGVVGWILLNPRRMFHTMRHRLNWRHQPQIVVVNPGRDAAGRPGGGTGDAGEPIPGSRRAALPTGVAPARPENRNDDVDPVTANPPPLGGQPGQPGAPGPAGQPPRRMPAPTGGGWSEPSRAEPPPNYVIYRPSGTPATTPAAAQSNGSVPRIRAEARRDT